MIDFQFGDKLHVNKKPYIFIKDGSGNCCYCVDEDASMKLIDNDLIDEVKKQKLYYCGSVFEFDGYIFMLCQTNFKKGNLINLPDGNRFHDVEIDLPATLASIQCYFEDTDVKYIGEIKDFL